MVQAERREEEARALTSLGRRTTVAVGREARETLEGSRAPAGWIAGAARRFLVVRRSRGGDADDGDREQWEQKELAMTHRTGRPSSRGAGDMEGRQQSSGRRARRRRGHGGCGKRRRRGRASSPEGARKSGIGRGVEEDWDGAEASPGGAVGRRTRGIERDVWTGRARVIGRV